MSLREGLAGNRVVLVLGSGNFDQLQSLDRRTGEIAGFTSPCAAHGHSYLGVFEGAAYFSSYCDPNYLFWSTDGTLEGRRRLFEGPPVRAIVGALPGSGKLVVFTEEHSFWLTDGTPLGSHPLIEGQFPISTPPGVAVGDRLVFLNGDREVWATDGTRSGSHQIFGEDRNSDLTVRSLVVWGDRALFVAARRFEADSLYVTDGTEAGTVELLRVPDPDDNIEFSTPRPGASRAYFTIERGGPVELWRTDGQSASTVALRSFPQSAFLSPERDLHVLGARAYFEVFENFARHLWTSDGTPEGTVDLGFNSSHSLRAVAGRRVVIRGGRPGQSPGLWSFGGETSLPTLVTNFPPEASFFDWVDDGGGDRLLYRLAFSSGPGVVRFGLTDGTPSGTFFLAGSLPFDPNVDRQYDVAARVLPSEGLPLLLRVGRYSFGQPLEVQWWRFDKDLAPLEVADLSTLFAEGSRVQTAVDLGSRLLVAGDDGQSGIELWGLSDGTRSRLTDRETHPNLDFERDVVVVNDSDALVFSETGVFPGSVVMTDGTPGGTASVTTGQFATSSVGRLDGEVYFTGTSSAWRTDFAQRRLEPLPGSIALPTLVGNLGDGSLVVADETELFTHDGLGNLATIGRVPQNRSLFSVADLPGGRVVATSDGAYRVEPNRPPVRLWETYSEPGGFFAGTERAYSLTAGSHHFLFTTDGSTAGTRLLGNFPATGFGFEAALLGDRLVFARASEEFGVELFISDGTGAAMQLVADLNPGPFSSRPTHLRTVGDRIFFRADDGLHGFELWVTDGTPAGTTRLTDLVPGGRSSYPTVLGETATEVLFAATNGDLGFELWALPKDASGAAIDAVTPRFDEQIPPAGGTWLTSPALPGFRFQVRLAATEGALPARLESSCLPETVCLSGAIPGRPEIFLRVVGPRPNGYLWPTLVKFTTTAVEVWIEQLGSGEIRHYFLAGARPGFDELPARFDRLGFRPSASVSAELVPAPGAAAGPPAPTEGAWLETNEIPAFRFKVRITAGPGQNPPVRRENLCIAETLCVSGAIAGRSEVFVRVVGPKPNGYLWPTLARFTSSTVEVWIEKRATGEVQYYQLPGATPDSDDLTGLFDRTGFRP